MKLSTKFTSLSIALLLCVPASANAEVTYRCKGVWQSTPCANGAASEVIEVEAKSPEERKVNKQLSVKRSMLHELRMQAIEAKRDYGVRFSLAESEYVCLQAASDMSECRKVVNESSSTLAEMTVARAKIQKQDATRERRTETEENTEISNSQNQSVVVLDQGRRNPYYGGHYSGRSRPVFTPGPFGNPYGGYAAGASSVIVPRGGHYGPRGGAAISGSGYGYGGGFGFGVGGSVVVPR